MKKRDQFDFWYAVHNTEVVLMPTRRLDTFGATLLNYHMLSELMDSVNQVRVREGRIEAFRPRILTPAMLSNVLLEGFGKEAGDYLQWLQAHAADLRFLQYGFTIRKQEVSEHVVSENLKIVLEQVRQAVRVRDDPLGAIVVGVDKPWEVCLLKLMVDVIRNSFAANLRDLDRRHLLDNDAGVPRAVRQEIEEDFKAAAHNPSLVKELGAKLHRSGLFEEYQDRFFALLRSGG
jgi:hypothetical protein